MPVVPGLANLAVLARGGHATVYRATQVAAYRDVAVKVENGTLDDERDQRRFLREARAAGRMSSHPHVVDLYDVGVTEDGHPYMIMELCHGNFGQRMRAEPLKPAQARDVGAKIADALAGAHAEGVLHRDVKPENILITRFDEPVLADFGLAVLAEAREQSITLELTPAYAAPEMFSSGRAQPVSDVYALCATLYALMSGRPPRWRENNANPSLATLMDLFSEQIPGLPGVPDDLMALLRRGMSNDPGQRPSAVGLRDTLRGAPGSSATGARDVDRTAPTDELGVGHRDPDPTMVMRRVPGQADGDDPTQATARVVP